jgi:hypothetical protein
MQPTPVGSVIGLIPIVLVHPDHSDLLKSNYEALSNGRVLQDLAAELHEVAGFRCPMCNFDQTATVDRFLPRSIYAEFGARTKPSRNSLQQ